MTIIDGALQSVPRATLREGALSQIRNSILDGRLTPGTQLGEVAVSDQLGISRGTVRESFRTLQQEGLIEPHGRGLRVRLMTNAQIQELFIVRGELEGLAVEQILSREDREEIIDSVAEKLPPEVGSDLDYAARLDADLSFHRALVAGAGMELLMSMWTNLENSARVVVLAARNEEAAPFMGQEHHAPIVEAMRAGDAQAARSALKSHMSASAKFFTSDAASDD